MGGLYFTLALLSAIGTYSAIIQARRLYWAAPLYFLSAWLPAQEPSRSCKPNLRGFFIQWPCSVPGAYSGC